MNYKFLGQCGFWIKDGSFSIAIDPVLTDLKDDEGFTLRNYPPVMKPEELDVKYLFCTHDHIDHLVVDTVMQVCNEHENTKVVVPKGCVSMLLEQGLAQEKIIALGDGEFVEPEAGLCIKGFSTAHPVHQKDEAGLDRNLAFCIFVGNKTIVHLGDTYLTDRLLESLQSCKNIDLFLPPINGRDEEREKRGIIGNLSPMEAARLSKDLKASYTVPTHFDMIAGNTVDLAEFVRAMESLGQGGKYSIPILGQWQELS